jgi:hypothetical protein
MSTSWIFELLQERQNMLRNEQNDEQKEYETSAESQFAEKIEKLEDLEDFRRKELEESEEEFWELIAKSLQRRQNPVCTCIAFKNGNHKKHCNMRKRQREE